MPAPSRDAEKRRATVGRALSLLVFLAVVCFIGLYLKSNGDLLRPLMDISLVDTLLLTALAVTMIGMNGLFLKAFAAKFGIDLTPPEWFGLASITAMGNYLTPFSGGLIARATYLKHRHALPYARFLALITANYLVVFWVVGVTGILTISTFWHSNLFFWQIALFFTGVVIVISVLLAVRGSKIPGNNRLARSINAALEGWDLIRSDRTLLGTLITYSLINIILNGVLFLAAYHAIGCEVPVTTALLVSLLSVFSLLVRITPGNFGIQEAIISLGSEILGSGAGIGLLVSLLIRAASLIPILILGPIFSFVLTRKLAGNRK